MAIKIQKVGKRIRPKNLYQLRLDFMIGDADHFYNTELKFDPDSKEESYVFEKLVRLFKRAVGHYTSNARVSKQEIADEIAESLNKDEKFYNWIKEKWKQTDDFVLNANDFFSEHLDWGTCEYNGDYHRLTNIDYWYVDTDGDKCKVSFTGSMKL